MRISSHENAASNSIICWAKSYPAVCMLCERCTQLAWNLRCRPGWPQVWASSLASAFCMLGLGHALPHPTNISSWFLFTSSSSSNSLTSAMGSTSTSPGNLCLYAAGSACSKTPLALTLKDYNVSYLPTAASTLLSTGDLKTAFPRLCCRGLGSW